MVGARPGLVVYCAFRKVACPWSACPWSACAWSACACLLRSRAVYVCVHMMCVNCVGSVELEGATGWCNAWKHVPTCYPRINGPPQSMLLQSSAGF